MKKNNFDRFLESARRGQSNEPEPSSPWLAARTAAVWSGEDWNEPDPWLIWRPALIRTWLCTAGLSLALVIGATFIQPAPPSMIEYLAQPVAGPVL